MLAEIRKCVEAHDIKGLRYIFVDCLDVDPTFEKYREDYEYCKSIPELFDNHLALNGIITDESKWTSQYWDQLKIDLMKNFSVTRFEHMIVVAKIVYADKISRLLNERGVVKQNEKSRNVNVKAESSIVKSPVADNREYKDLARPLSDAELQDRKIAEKKRRLEAENRRVEAEQEAQRARIEAARRESANKGNVQGENSELKKVLGIVLAIIVIVVVVLLVMALH